MHHFNTGHKIDDIADIQNGSTIRSTFKTGSFEGQWSSNQEVTIGLSSTHHVGSNEVGEGLGKWHLVRNKRVEFSTTFFFGRNFDLRPFISQPKSQKDTNVALF